MRKTLSVILAVLTVAAGGGIAATVVADEGTQVVPKGVAVTEDGPPAVDELAPDPEGREGRPAPADGQRGEPPTYVPGEAKLIDPSSDLGRRLNPDQDPNVRLCRNPDGTIVVIHAYPIPGRDPFPNTPGELRRRPC